MDGKSRGMLSFYVLFNDNFTQNVDYSKLFNLFQGHVTSYFSPALQKYTSFQVHSNQEVRDIHTFDEGILALTQSSLRCQMRRGIPIYTHTSANLVEMQCLMQISTTNVLMGGHQPHLINFDFNTSQESQLVSFYQIKKLGFVNFFYN